MKYLIPFLFLCGICLSTYSQDIQLTFTGIGESDKVDSLLVINLETNDTLSMNGDGVLNLGTATGIQNQIRDLNELLVYPNPFSGETSLVVMLQTSQNVQIDIRNLLGQQIAQTQGFLSKGSNNFRINIREPGMYVVILNTNEGAQSQQLICTETTTQSNAIVFTGEDSKRQMKTGIIEPDGPPLQYTLAFSMGDTLAFICSGGIFKTTITDCPEYSREYEIEFVDCTDDDGKTYPIVEIGDQTWMAENLAFLPSVSPPDLGSDTVKYYYVSNYYGDDISEAKDLFANYSYAAVLYNWPAAQDACPPGWHLPFAQDWQELAKYLGPEASQKMQCNVWDNSHPNKSQFSAYDGTFRHHAGDFARFMYGSFNTWFWSSSVDLFSLPVHIDIEAIHQEGTWPERHRSNGFSIRCIRNEADIKTAAISNVSATSALSGGIIPFSEDLEIEERGICWDTHADPTVADNKTSNGQGLGEFSSEINQLNANTSYFVRAYFTTVFGEVFYGEQETFTTLDGTFVDSRDSTSYGYVHIGSQTWMATNLCATTESGSWSYNSDEDFPKAIGYYYDSVAALSACPVGWHLPSNQEWMILIEELGDSVGPKMRSKSNWQYGLNGTNNSRFNALPTGYYDARNASQPEHSGFGMNTTFATSDARPKQLHELSNGLSLLRQRFFYSPDNGNSVRCLMNKSAVITSRVIHITDSTAISGGNILYYSNDSEIQERGVCWNTYENPKLSDNRTIDGVGSGSFISEIKDLNPASSYYVRSYFTTISGDTIYGNQYTFNTVDGAFVDDRDGTTYGFVEIGTQVWMAENLNYSLSNGTWCYENVANCETYGQLYDFETALTVCPAGWHLPSEDEWTYLKNYLEDDVTKKMKSTWGWDVDGGHNGDNRSRFNALPAGRWDHREYFWGLGNWANFWSSTPDQNSESMSFELPGENNYNTGHIYPQNVNNGYSVRCLKNESPQIMVEYIRNITDASASIGGEIIDIYNTTEFLRRGICWSTLHNPTIEDSKVEEEGGPGRFEIQLSGLEENTQYLIRPYYTTSRGDVQYGQEEIFTTKGSFVDSRDGKNYSSVIIGMQTWMAENLAYLPSISGPNNGSETDPFYYINGYSGSSLTEARNHLNYKTYGVLYNWPAATADNHGNGKDVCPEGWHLPREYEWTQLINYLIDNGYGYEGRGIDIGKSMASSSGWDYSSIIGSVGNDQESNNSSGFNALAGGYRHPDGSFRRLGSLADFWSASQDGTSQAWRRGLYNEFDGLDRKSNLRSYGFSVRCLQD